MTTVHRRHQRAFHRGGLLIECSIHVVGEREEFLKKKKTFFLWETCSEEKRTFLLRLAAIQNETNKSNEGVPSSICRPSQRYFLFSLLNVRRSAWCFQLLQEVDGDSSTHTRTETRQICGVLCVIDDENKQKKTQNRGKKKVHLNMKSQGSTPHNSAAHTIVRAISTSVGQSSHSGQRRSSSCGTKKTARRRHQRS